MFKSGNGGSMDGIPALAGNKAVVTNGIGTLTTSVTTATEISYVNGVTSSIQTQLNGKQPTGNYITALTGDVTASGPGSAAATLATVNAGPGSFGATNKTLSATVNSKGLVTAIADAPIAITSSQVSGTFPFSSITGTVPINQGGTGQTTAAAAFNALSPMTTVGDLIYGGASGTATRLANGTTGQFLGANTGAAPSWQNVSAVTTPPTVQRFLSGSGTYTTPGGVSYIRIKMVGAGGGGAGGGQSTAGAGSNGNNTTFGSAFLTAGGGAGGIWTNVASVGASGGGLGGVNTIPMGPTYIITTSGGQGLVGSFLGNAQFSNLGGAGGGNFFGSGGAGGIREAGQQPSAYGAGGGGGGSDGNYGTGGGAGGGAGGYIECLIKTPSTTYAYSVGSGGAGGTAGVSGFAGGSGLTGAIIIEEYY